jgi:hypothetical protein
VRRDEVRAGQVYRVEVPRHLQPRRYPMERLGLGLWWQLSMLRGSYFELSVTNPQVPVGPHAWVEGWRMVKKGLVEVELTAEQVRELGLPGSMASAVRIRGTLCGPGGAGLNWPDLTTVCVPARWLYPLEAERPPRRHATN